MGMCRSFSGRRSAGIRHNIAQDRQGEESQGPCISAGLREIDSYQRSASVPSAHGWERVIEFMPHGSRLQFGALNHGRRTAINRGSVCPQLPANRTLHENHKATRMTRSGLRLVHSAPSSQVIGRATMLVATIDHAVPIVRNVRTTAATDESVLPYSGAKRLRLLSLYGARRDGRSWSHPSDQISLVLAVPESTTVECLADAKDGREVSVR